ncbi:MAG: TonB-dependent receptor [Bacteroidales bacterium]|nr:TonB-dependent receptor [Bacteroidales bacterium]
MKTRLLFCLSFLLMSFIASWAQTKNIKGCVISGEDMQPLPGVAVLEKGTTNGTVTDIDGRYSLNVKEDATIVVSFIGFVTQEQPVAGFNTIDVTLESDSKELDELIVVGYGVQKKSDLTGSVTSVREDDLKSRSTTDAAAALQGKVSGVQILNNSGAPGTAAQIRVRGYSSNSGNIGPLLIVDGLKVDNIQYLDPSMIKSMEVLKDAASAAIYGAQAGNGVVLITTKNGSAGNSSITYEGKFTSQSLGKKAELFDGDSYVKYQMATGKITQADLDVAGYKPGQSYDWFDAVFENSWSKQHSLIFQGGNERGHFLASINYVNNDGIVKGKKDTYERLTSQVNADYEIKKWFKVSSNNSIEKWATKSVSQASYGSMLNSVMAMDPLTPAYYSKIEDCATAMKQHYELGDPIPTDPKHNNDFYATSKFLEEATGNPLFQRDKTDSSSKGFTVRGTTSLMFQPVDFLTFTSRLGYRIAQSNSHSYEKPYWLTGMASSSNYSISANVNTSYYYQFENFLNFDKTFAGLHTVGLMAGMAYEEHNDDNASISSQGTDILSSYEPNFLYINYLKGDATKTVGNAPGKSTNTSFFGRLTYNYNDRYSVQFNLRADAFDSSKLSKEARWGKFPSVSAGWTISNENFFRDNITPDVVSFLKLRGSWGRNGNINVLSGYQYSTTIALNSQWYQYNGNDGSDVTYGSGPSGLANPSLKWETSEQVDLGFDARFLDSRLSLGFDWYKKTTKDLLLQINPIPEIGVKSTFVNAGEVENRGIEIELGWKDQIGDLHYGINANLSTLKNEVKEMTAALDHLEGTRGGVSGLNYKTYTRFEAGEPIWYFCGYKYAGVDKETGKPQYYDKDGKVVNEVTDNDMQKIGKAIPDATYGITLNLEYKGIDFTVYGTGSAGNDIFSLLYSADRPRSNSLKLYSENAWTPDNKNAKYAAVDQVVSDWTYWSSDVSLFNGSFFKFKQIQLGYTLPKSITEKVYVSNCRVFASLDDFFTITKYPGCDPETATTSNQKDMGYDCGTYPTTKKVVFGVSVTF